MSQLIFQSISGGSTTLNGTNTAGTYNLTVPAADGTLLYQDTSGNITFNNIIVTGTLSITGTSAFKIPSGNTVQRPGVPVAGDIRYNTDGGGLYEGYLPAVSAWYKFQMIPEGQYTITYVIVAGGGGGGGAAGGGGGAGGVIINTFTAIPSSPFTMTIGAGGPNDTNGYNSSISGVATAIGGGHGGNNSAKNGTTGGSGGGASGSGAGVPPASGGQGTLGQGNSGSGTGSDPYTSIGAGGGGGATTAGVGGGFSGGGAGGTGATTSISGTTQVVGGGGGGAGPPYTVLPGGAGGSGGGGAGAAGGGGAGGNGSVSTGGGGGGGGGTGGTGGSGVIYLSMPTANYSGTTTGSPTVITYASTTVLVYTNSGTYTA